MHRDEILDEGDLPLRFTAYSPCFRREADQRGRTHAARCEHTSSTKSAPSRIATPEQSSAVHDDILHRAESIIADLGLAYRVLDLCSGDLGFRAPATFDI